MKEKRRKKKLSFLILSHEYFCFWLFKINRQKLLILCVNIKRIFITVEYKYSYLDKMTEKFYPLLIESCEFSS